MDLFLFDLAADSIQFYMGIYKNVRKTYNRLRGPVSVPDLTTSTIVEEEPRGKSCDFGAGGERGEQARDDLKPLMSYPRMLGILFVALLVARMVRLHLPCLKDACSSVIAVSVFVPLVEGLVVWFLGNMSELQGSISYTLLGALCMSPLYFLYPTNVDLDAITVLVSQSFFRVTSTIRAC